MLLPDPSIDLRSLAALAHAEFGVTRPEIEFVPVGGDSWNFRTTEWWISVRRDRQGHDPAAYEAACELREKGHDFVLAPSRGRSGRVVFDVDHRPVVVSPFVEGRTAFPTGLGIEALAALARAVDSLHAATVVAPVKRETFDLFFTGELDGALRRAEEGADDAGPFARDVSLLLRRNRERISSWRAEIADCQRACRNAAGRFVLTHAEPAPPNVMVTRAQQLFLLDWGDLLWAPPERDARALAELGIGRAGRSQFERFYELRWILGEVAEYAARLTSPHPGDSDDHEKRRELGRYLI
jgi:spectinomycin phosphotransferase